VQRLARTIGARSLVNPANVAADIVWFCVPDAEIARTAAQYSDILDWKGKIALHSSGALSSDELNVLRNQGASVASVHPLMTFVTGTTPSLRGVPFAIEGDGTSLRAVRRIVRALGGTSYLIAMEDKAAYHAWGTFISPLLTSLLVTSERVAGLAGVSPSQARHRMGPIVRRTVENYSAWGGAVGFSGPIIRGDAEIVKQHLRVLKSFPAALQVYSALANSALELLPAKNRDRLRSILKSESRPKRIRTGRTKKDRPGKLQRPEKAMI
jgi:predicted short-subunit dehydrogenase-like oxidoreductase (DUF2520 family)